MVPTPHDEVTLYAEPGPLFDALERAVDEAREVVWLATYIFRRDALGERFARCLARAAQRGVDTRLLYDAVGSRHTERRIFQDLSRSGVSVQAYRPWHFSPQRWKYWPRDHGRLVIVDGTGYTGGINWGVEWLPIGEGGCGWHDVSVGVRGPCARDFRRVFLRRWREADGTRASDKTSQTGSDGRVRLVAESSSLRGVIARELAERAFAARRRVWLENAYFVPPPFLLDALTTAARRGADVRLILPAKTDIPILRAIAHGEYADWMRRGLKLYEYQPSMVHSKFAVVDDDWGTVGTFNALSPGAWWANETNVTVEHAPFVRELAAVFERDVAQSVIWDPRKVERVASHRRLAERLLARAYRWLERIVLAVEHRGEQP